MISMIATKLGAWLLIIGGYTIEGNQMPIEPHVVRGGFESQQQCEDIAKASMGDIVQEDPERLGVKIEVDMHIRAYWTCQQEKQ